MSLETQQITNALRNCQVLIVEDDVPLAERIAALFKGYTNREPLIARCIEEAQQVVAQAQENFDLAIVDVMLPPAKEDFDEIQEHEKTLERVRNVIEKVGPPPHNDNAKKELFDARYERAQALRQIESLIDRDGGIELVAEWRKLGHLYPILFLTAVGNDTSVRRGLSLAGEYSDWIVKPVPSEIILEKCVNLLLKRRAQAGDGQL